jgi:putative tryptophan/tyrosine transport system substrate-binding protein
MNRREVIAGLGGSMAWPALARSQQPSRMRTLALLSGAEESDQNNRGWLSTFDAALQSFGWIDGQNIRIEEGSPLLLGHTMLRTMQPPGQLGLTSRQP